MTPERHQQVKQVFFQVCELNEDDRLPVLEAACRGDESLHQEVLSLLKHDTTETLLAGLSDTNLLAQRSVFAPPPDAWVGKRLGKYHIVRYLDGGGMGFVLEAKDEMLGRHVAIKVLHAEYSQEESMRTRFLAEARAAAKLNHPNVITIHEVAQQDDLYFIVMEFAEEGSVASQLAEQGAYSLEEATEIAIQACQGLAAAHQLGMIHRDMKPANLLIGSGGHVKISDFGIAKSFSSNALQLTHEGQIVGTPSYMSPEQCEGKPVDPRTDIYSLGATYYSLLVGKPPYDDRDSLISVINAHCNAEPPNVLERREQLPAACAAIVQRAMAKSPADRFQTAQEMSEALQELLGADSAATAKLRSKEQRFALLGRSALLASLGILLLSVSAVLFFWRSSDEALPEPISEAGNPAAAIAQQPIKVGILHSLSGTMALTEAAMVDACMFAIDEVNAAGGINGRPLEPVLVDGKSDETVFAAEAKRLIEAEEVCTIFGCCTSSSRKAVVPVVEAADHLLVYAANTEGVETSPNVIYLGGDPMQTIIPCVQWAYGFRQQRTFFLVGSDYVFPRIANEIVKDQLDLLGAILVGEEYLPLGSADVHGIVDKIAELKPDAIINTISGDSQSVFSRVLRARKVESTQFATGVGEQELRSADISKLIDDYSVGTYFQSLPSPENVDFVQRFQKRFGRQRVVNAATESSYAGVLLWAQAARACGSTSPTELRQAMLQQKIVAPSGPIFFDQATHYAYRCSFIGNVESNGQFRIVWQSPSSEPPNPFPPTRTSDEWLGLLDQLHTRWNGRWSAPIAD